MNKQQMNACQRGKPESVTLLKRVKFEYLYYILCIAILLPFSVFSQENDFAIELEAIREMPDDTLKVISLIDFARANTDSDPTARLNIYSEATLISEKIKYDQGLANSHRNAGVEYYFLSDYLRALEEWKSAEIYFLRISDNRGLANVLSNAGAVYFNLNRLDEALEFYLRSLKLAEEVKDFMRKGTVFSNIGALHARRDEFDQAIDRYLEALSIFKELGYAEGIGLAALNAGEMFEVQSSDSMANEMYLIALSNLLSTPYYSSALRLLGLTQVKLGDFPQGLVLLDSAYNVATRANNLYDMANANTAIALLYEQDGNIPLAITYYEKAKSEAKKVDDDNAILESIAMGLVRLYSSNEDFARAFENQQLYQRIQESNNDIENERKFNSMLFGFEMDKKEVEIAEQQALVKAKRNQQYGLGSGFFLMGILALVFFTQRKRISKEKARSEELLLNILPYEVAEELKVKGSAEAKLIDQVTVLFTDFNRFTVMSEMLTPKELVKNLHDCFSLFDNICQKYGIEKIKTIGDAYMAVGGLSSLNTTHAQDAVKAAFEMIEVVENGKAKKIEQGLPFFEIRIGLHTGPVVAGIVGVKKFQYDIWGDTVNTASRMESSGEVGKVNISQTTYELLKDDAQINFESRGKIEAKGKGEIEMYFASKI